MSYLQSCFPSFCIYLHILILFFLSVSTIVISFSTIFKCFPLRLKHVFTFFFFKCVSLFFPDIRIVIMYVLRKVEKVKDEKSPLTSAHQPPSSPDDSEWVPPVQSSGLFTGPQRVAYVLLCSSESRPISSCSFIHLLIFQSAVKASLFLKLFEASVIGFLHFWW